MNILILHQNFPGQFRNIATYLAKTGHNVLGVGEKQAPGIPGVRTIRYEIKNPPKPSHAYLGVVTNAATRGEAVAKLLAEVKKQGWTPHVILAHPGWGEALFVKDVFPETRLVSLFEFYYHAKGVDVGFEPGAQASLDLAATLTARNMLHLMNLERCDAGVSPTKWQKSLHPAAYQPKIRVAHEGINTTLMAPDPEARFALADGRKLTRVDKVISYVARHLEPYRGFPQFMRALPEIQRRNPEAVAVIVGGDGISYGRKPEDAPNWREKMLAEVGGALDLSRVVFTGQIPYADYRALLQISAAHVYLTYPFVLSWSALEAMSCGCLLVGSATPPVLEVAEDGKNALLFPFFEGGELAGRVSDALERPGDFAPLRQAARDTVVRGFGIEQGLRAYLDLLAGRPNSATDSNEPQ
jgi:glycosyltransferase involved in cell wall biosynthesis